MIYERGLLFREGEFEALLQPGRYLYFDPLYQLSVEIEDVTLPSLVTPELDVIVASEALQHDALVIDLADGERALVWVDGRLADALTPGRYAYWTVVKDVRVERVNLDAKGIRFSHPALATVLAAGAGTLRVLEERGPGRPAYRRLA